MVLPEVTSSPLREKWGIFLKNVGTGPAEINYKSVMLDGRVSNMLAVFIKMKEEGVLAQKPNVGIDTLQSGTYLGVDGSTAILEVDPESVIDTALQQFIDFLRRRINIRYEACSVYEECEEGCTADPCVVSQR